MAPGTDEPNAEDRGDTLVDAEIIATFDPSSVTTPLPAAFPLSLPPASALWSAWVEKEAKVAAY